MNKIGVRECRDQLRRQEGHDAPIKSQQGKGKKVGGLKKKWL